MGELLKADLSFGVALDDEQIEDLPWAYEEGGEDARPSFTDWLEQLEGLVSPIPSEIDSLPWHLGKEKFDEWTAIPANREALDAYNAAVRRIEEECPIGVVSVYRAGEDGSSACVIAVKSSIQTADWQGGPDPCAVSVEVAEGEVEAARIFCEKHGIPFDEPKWLLSVMR